MLFRSLKAFVVVMLPISIIWCFAPQLIPSNLKSTVQQPILHKLRTSIPTAELRNLGRQTQSLQKQVQDSASQAGQQIKLQVSQAVGQLQQDKPSQPSEP